MVEKGTGVSISGAHVMIYQTGEDAPWLEWQTDKCNGQQYRWFL